MKKTPNAFFLLQTSEARDRNPDEEVRALVTEEEEFAHRDELLITPNFGFFRLSSIQRKHKKEFFYSNRPVQKLSYRLSQLEKLSIPSNGEILFEWRIKSKLIGLFGYLGLPGFRRGGKN